MSQAYWATGGPTTSFLYCPTDSSYEVGIVETSPGNRLVNDTFRGVLITAQDGSRISGVGEGDDFGVFHGLYQQSDVWATPTLKHRYAASGNDAAVSLRRSHTGFTVTAGDSTVKLCAAAWDGLDQFVAKASTAGTVTVQDSAGAALTSGTIAAGSRGYRKYRRVSGVWVLEASTTY